MASKSIDVAAYLKMFWTFIESKSPPQKLGLTAKQVNEKVRVDCEQCMIPVQKWAGGVRRPPPSNFFMPHLDCWHPSSFLITELAMHPTLLLGSLLFVKI